jgi:uncharacterized protein with beta-barrel porin domain
MVAVLAMTTAANAACAPPAVNATNPAPGTTVTCSGATADQNVIAGYGTGDQTGITINVAPGATVTGTVNYGIFVQDAAINNSGGVTGTNQGIYSQMLANVNNSVGASVAGGVNGVNAGDTASVTNFGTISGTSDAGIYSSLNISATNNAGATISGGQWGLRAETNVLAQVTLVNSGNVFGFLRDGVSALGAVTVTNTSSGTISGGSFGARAGGDATVTNSGSITGTSDAGVEGGGNVTVTNTAGALISGGFTGIRSVSGSVALVNSGGISGALFDGIYADRTATVTNSAAASIFGGGSGITTGFGSISVVNAGSIIGGANAGLYAANANATLTNSATGVVLGILFGVRADSGTATVVNSGTVTATDATGIAVFGQAASVTNNAGATILGGDLGISAAGQTATVANSGTIIGSASYGVFGFAGVNVTNNAGGSISGNQYGIGADITGGGSSVFNTGTISGGTAAIRFGGSGNKLTLAPTSVISGNVLGTGADTFQLGGSGAGTFDISALGAAGQYQGFSVFNKVGSATWTLTGTSGFTGPINVNEGTLSVNGNLASASALTVNAGGTLGGTGIVGNTLINGGTLAPGNSIGTLTVQGNLVLTAAASYLIEISPASADRTNVAGTATLGGAAVNASFAPGTFVARQYTILNAAGGVSGSFGNLVNTNLPSGFKSSLSYDANNAYLDLEVVLAQYSGLNVNQRNVANALTNYFNTTGGIPLVFGSLTPAGLTQASGEHATGAQQTTYDAMRLFLGVLTDPFVAGRNDRASIGAAPFADERPTTGFTRDAYAAVAKAAPRPPQFEQRWSLWGAGFGGAQTTDGYPTLGANTATSRIAGIAAGADYWLSPFTVAGFALAGGATSFNVNGLGSGRSDLFQAGGFVRHNVGAAYLTAATAYGWQDITTDRTVSIAGLNRFRGRFDANAFSGRAEAGHRYVVPLVGGVGLTPYAAAQITAFDLPDYAEQVLAGTNTFALNYAAKTVTASRSEFGLRSDKSYALDTAILTLRGRTAWAHDFNTDRSIAATFQTLPGASFVVNGARPARDAALTTASAELKWTNGLSLAASFEGEFSDVTRSYAGKGIARYQW